MNYQEFINTYNGQEIDYDGSCGVQCVDLIMMYIDKVFERPGIIYANAKDYYEKYGNYQVLIDLFTQIPNTPDFVPQKGDVVVWGSSVGRGYGHIAIATGEGDTNHFISHDQNWNGKAVHEVDHTYSGVLGVLRPDDQSKINPLPDLRYKAHIQDIGWTDWIGENGIAGTTGEAKRIEAIVIEGHNGLDLNYRVHMEEKGWSDFVGNGQVAGTTGEKRKIEAIEINANKSLEVQEHVQDIGWVPVSKGNHIKIGTEGKDLRLEAFRIRIL